MKHIFLTLKVIYFSLFLFSCNPSVTQENIVEQEDNEISRAQEPHRPQFHFSPPQMWMNDPNGMVYFNGEYHLFYQHFPDSTVWGPMHWGHAVSKDLIHWEHLPIALYPDSLGHIFSGSAVYDKNNTSGFGTKDNPPLVAIFTNHLMEAEKEGRIDYQTQGVAFSTDNGRTWKKYENNPVLSNPGIKDFRDPKVFWHEETKRWIMILAVSDHMELFGSDDLKDWNKLSEFGRNSGAHGGVWECPDLFPLAVDGQKHNKWVMLVSINPGGLYGGSATQYFIGDFDGKTFKNDNPEEKILWLDYGKDNYAGVTWSNVPDGRRIFMGWMSNWQYADVVPTDKWRSAMTLPRTLHLVESADGLRVASWPVQELENIRGEVYEFPEQLIEGKKEITDLSFDVKTSEIILEYEFEEGVENFGVSLFNLKDQRIIIGFDVAKNSFYVDRRQSGKDDFSKEFSGIHYAPRMKNNKKVKLHLIVDVASVEVFADDGTAVLTDIFFPHEDYSRLQLFSEGKAIRLNSGKIISLSSIWGTENEESSVSVKE